MKRRGGSSREGLGRGEENGKGTRKEGRNDNNRKKEKEKPPPPPVIDTVATRTRRQKRDIATKWKQPISILIHIMGYADPETIRMLCCVSKQFCDIIYNNPGMEHNRAIPLLQITPAADTEDDGRMERVFCFLQHHRDKLQLYREIKIIDANKFVCLSPNDDERRELYKITKTLRLYGIVSLDMSSPPLSSTDIDNIHAHPYFFPSILPNLRDINLSNNKFSYLHSYVAELSTKCPNLEKITWHNIDRDQSMIDINGWDLRQATNLKEIYMDDSAFSFHGNERDHLSDLENDEHSNIFLFYKCSTKLERVSILNAKWSIIFKSRDDPTVIPQNALIKFVRKAPTSLKWFRSDLSHENMNMLRSERPGIELVN